MYFLLPKDSKWVELGWGSQLYIFKESRTFILLYLAQRVKSRTKLVEVTFRKWEIIFCLASPCLCYLATGDISQTLTLAEYMLEEQQPWYLKG